MEIMKTLRGERENVKNSEFSPALICAMKTLLRLIKLHMLHLFTAAIFFAVACTASPTVSDFDADLRLVKSHVASNYNQTFREPSGSLVFPYLVPSGPYDELWDWDSFFMGVSLLEYGSLPYLVSCSWAPRSLARN